MSTTCRSRSLFSKTGKLRPTTHERPPQAHAQARWLLTAVPFGLGNIANPPSHWTAIFSTKNLIFYTVMKHHPAHWGLHHHLKVCASSAAIPAQRCMASLPTASPFYGHFFGGGLKQGGKLENETTAFQKSFFLLSQNCIFILCKNGKIIGSDRSVSSAPAARPGGITDPAWGTEGRSCPTPPLHHKGHLQWALSMSKTVVI